VRRRVARDAEGGGVDEGRRRRGSRVARARVGSEGQEGMRAFLEKREPNW